MAGLLRRGRGCRHDYGLAATADEPAVFCPDWLYSREAEWLTIAQTAPTMKICWSVASLIFALSACGVNPGAQKGETGDQGPPGPAGPAGPPGQAGTRGTVIRFVETECRQVCFVACAESERILSSYAINPGGTFTFNADNTKASFRPQQQGVPIKVVLACVQK